MCWITLTPSPKPKCKPKHGHGHKHHHPEDGSSVAELVRVHRKGAGACYSKVRIIAPVHGPDKHDHHGRHPHVHPLHMHPPQDACAHDAIHGSGRKRDAARRHPPSCPPPSTASSTCARTSEATYKTQIVEPARREVREMTRIALRELRPDRGRLRRVAGYEVLGKEMPWDWDCVSSVASGRGRSGKGGSRGRSGRSGTGSSQLRYPPFGSVERWM